MSPIDRRQVLAAGGALLLGGAGNAQSAEPPAPPAIPVPDSWRTASVVPLWPGRPPGAAPFSPAKAPAGWPDSYRRAVATPELRVFRPERPNGLAVLAIPGGAYWFVSFVNEGADVAANLTRRGFTVFVLVYRLPGEGWASRADVPLQDAQRAIRLIRARASDYRVDPRRVFAVGFSAGGHLAATLATAHAERVYAPVDATDALDARPLAAALIYPVITLQDPWTHELSRRLLLGDQPTRAQIDARSADLHVGATTPPLFLVHAVDDAAVPVENSLRMMAATRAARRPVEAHFLQEGGHAFGVGRAGTPSAQWIDLMAAWVERLG
jgi:acetyl esterase/lipase